VIKEPTSSVFILRRNRERGWLTALVWHPRLDCWVPAGGHVEPDETAAQCAIREALETGLDITLDPGPAVPVPAGFPHRLLPAPWLVAEGCADPDRHTSAPHVHVDHIYAATTDGSRPVREPEHQVRWFTTADIATAPGISEDSRLLAARLLTLAAIQPGPQFRWPPEQDQAMPARHRAQATARTGAPPSEQQPKLIVIRGNCRHLRGKGRHSRAVPNVHVRTPSVENLAARITLRGIPSRLHRGVQRLGPSLRQWRCL